jgi:hypothetical protein
LPAAYIDTASLTIALLRAANIPARYVIGTIEVDADKLNNWVGGTDTVEAAISLIGQRGIPNLAVTAGGKIAKVRLEHAWVKAYVNWVPARGAKNYSATQHINANPSLNAWVDVDTSYKQHEFTGGIDVLAQVPFDAAQLVAVATDGATIDNAARRYQSFNAENINAYLTGYEQRVRQYLAQRSPALPIDALMQKVTIRQGSNPLLAGSLPFSVRTSSSLQALPSTMRMSVSLNAYASELDAALDAPSTTVSTSLPKLGVRRLGVTFVPSTPGDAAALAAAVASDDVAELPAYLINVKAQVELDGALLAEAPAAQLGSTQFWEVVLTPPWGGTPYSYRFKATAGSEIVFGVTGSGLSEAVIKQRFQAVPSNTAAENLHQLALHYWFEQDLLARMNARRQGVGYQLLSAFGKFSSPLTVTSSFFGIPRFAAYKGRSMDVAHTLYGIAASDKAKSINLAELVGVESSFLEGAVQEQLFGQPFGRGISAVSQLHAANAQGIPIFVIEQDNAASVLPLLRIGTEARSNIANAIAAGKRVIVSETEPERIGYRGVGYIIEDPEDGTGAYLIDGGLNGGALPDCACEKVKVPKAQAIYEFLATLITLAILAAIIAETWGTVGPLVPAILTFLLRKFGIPALVIGFSSVAAAQTPPSCCLASGTDECPKPDLYRGGRASDANLHRIRLNWTSRRDGSIINEVEILPKDLILPPDTTCDSAALIPGLSESMTVVAGSGGASHDELQSKVSPPIWKLPKDVYPPPQLCLVHDGGSSGTHWTLGPKTNMSFAEFCAALRTFNGAYIRQ